MNILRPSGDCVRILSRFFLEYGSITFLLSKHGKRWARLFYGQILENTEPGLLGSYAYNGEASIPLVIICDCPVIIGNCLVSHMSYSKNIKGRGCFRNIRNEMKGAY